MKDFILKLLDIVYQKKLIFIMKNYGKFLI